MRIKQEGIAEKSGREVGLGWGKKMGILFLTGWFRNANNIVKRTNKHIKFRLSSLEKQLTRRWWDDSEHYRKLLKLPELSSISRTYIKYGRETTPESFPLNFLWHIDPTHWPTPHTKKNLQKEILIANVLPNLGSHMP